MTCAVVIISLLQYRIFGPPAIRTVRYPDISRLKVPMVGDYYYEKTWFIRCRNITLGYNIPIKTSKHILSNVRVYFDVNNPFTITPYTGLDPETDISSSESAPSQLQWAYPNVRTYSFGLDITF